MRPRLLLLVQHDVSQTVLDLLGCLWVLHCPRQLLFRVVVKPNLLPVLLKRRLSPRLLNKCLIALFFPAASVTLNFLLLFSVVAQRLNPATSTGAEDADFSGAFRFWTRGVRVAHLLAVVVTVFSDFLALLTATLCKSLLPLLHYETLTRLMALFPAFVTTGQRILAELSATPIGRLVTKHSRLDVFTAVADTNHVLQAGGTNACMTFYRAVVVTRLQHLFARAVAGRMGFATLDGWV